MRLPVYCMQAVFMGPFDDTMRVLVDLHVHSALSPCAENEMTPSAIVERALSVGLDAIAVTDHNSVGNVKTLYQAGAKRGLFVLPGMELQTREEVHLLCLFPSIEHALAWGSLVYPHLPDEPNRPDYFGEQLLFGDGDSRKGVEPRLLLNSTDLGVGDAVHMVRGAGGVCIPAHIDRPSYSLLANLGFVPPDLPVTALEVSWRIKPQDRLQRFGHLSAYSLICSSDAHRLSEIGLGATELTVKERTFGAVVSALMLLGGGHAP